MDSALCLLLNSYTCLAPLSDPIFGSENAPSPKRKENNRIDMCLLLHSYAFLAPLSDLIFRSELVPEPKREEHNGIVTF